MRRKMYTKHETTHTQQQKKCELLSTIKTVQHFFFIILSIHFQIVHFFLVLLSCFLHTVKTNTKITKHDETRKKPIT